MIAGLLRILLLKAQSVLGVFIRARSRHLQFFGVLGSPACMEGRLGLAGSVVTACRATMAFVLGILGPLRRA